MANINLSEAFGTVRFDSFGGINAQPRNIKGCVVSDIKNFRITGSGTLEKRSGYSTLMNLPDAPRAVMTVSEDQMFVLVGGQIYRSDAIMKTNTPISSVSCSEGEASFFKYEGSIFLLDGQELYRYENNGFFPVEGYVPLYAKEAEADTPLLVHEPLNLLSGRYRISFKMGDEIPSYIPFPFDASAIDDIRLNGAAADHNGFIMCGDSGAEILTDTIRPGDVVEFMLTMLSPPIDRAQVTNSNRATVFGIGKHGHAEASVAFYGGGDGRSLFTSRPVDSAEYLKVRSVYGNLSSLYVTEDDEAKLDDSITATSPCGTSLAVFLKSSAYLTEENEGRGTVLSCMSRAHGCSVKDGAISIDSAPITISDTGIFVWHPHDVYDGEYVAECISLPVSHLMPLYPASGFIYHNRRENEIWLHLGDERILVRSNVTGYWYTFTGFTPRSIFELGGRTAFTNGRSVFVFSEGTFIDLNAPIVASISASLISFGDFSRRKRLSRARLLCSQRSSFELTIIDSKGRVTNTELSDKGLETAGYVEKRLPARRARHYSFTLTNRAAEKATVSSLMLTAVK